MQGQGRVKQELQMSALSDRGQVRTQNQDRVFSDPESGLFVLADGVGGRAGGEIAAQLAVDTISRFLAHVPLWRRLWPRGAERPTLARLGEAVLAAHRAIQEQAAREPRLSRMSSTVVAGLVGQDQCLCACVGDSRLYRLRDGELLQLSRDQTVARRLVSEGYMPPGDARLRRYEHILTSVLGQGDVPEMQLFRVQLEPGDQLLACSDGLSGMLDDQDIRAILMRGQPLGERARALIEAANQAGGRDNVSLILIQPPGRPEATHSPLLPEGSEPCRISI